MGSNKDDGSVSPAKKSKKKGEREGGTVGDALRAVYQDAIAETVPDEMLDLLKKLG